MGEAALKLTYSIQEYLEIEQNSNEKYEYLAGEIFAMAGGTLNHSLISSNFIRSASNSIIKKSKTCRTYGSDAKIASSDEDFHYADAFVICGKTEVYPENPQAAKNPILIVEVLSPTTESYDRGAKFQYYQNIETFKEYILVSQDKILVEVFYKPENTHFWQYRAYKQLDDVIELKSIDCEITVNDIYLNWEKETV
ncbi:MAG: Uma2 family endonuclease [Spirosomataceae bacterium]